MTLKRFRPGDVVYFLCHEGTNHRHPFCGRRCKILSSEVYEPKYTIAFIPAVPNTGANQYAAADDELTASETEAIFHYLKWKNSSP